MVLFSAFDPSQLPRLWGGDVPPTTRDPLFSFGVREVTEHELWQEVFMGVAVTLPAAFLLGRIMLRLTCLKFPFLRADLVNAVIATLAGDAILELLLPSLKCVPTQSMFPSFLSVSWLETMWGLDCFIATSSDVLTPQAMGILMGMRVAFILMGLYLGQSFNPIAITGGIATGKSTVVQMLLEESEGELVESTTAATDDEKKENDGETTATKEDEDYEKESTRKKQDEDAMASFYVVDCDAIGHQILLPPSVIRKTPKSYTVTPRESVYNAVCKAFQDDDILITNGIEIDRVKLGTLVFGNAKKRKVLNRLTHPRIAWILWKRCVYGCFFSGKDLTVAEVPLLFESTSWMLRQMFCFSLMVTVESADVQMERLKKRNPNLSTEDCEKRFQAQMPLEKKARMANFVLNNGNDPETVRQDLKNIQQAWLDHIYGFGISAAQIVGIVYVTLVAGVGYQMYKQAQGEAEGNI